MKQPSDDVDNLPVDLAGLVESIKADVQKLLGSCSKVSKKSDGVLKSTKRILEETKIFEDDYFNESKNEPEVLREEPTENERLEKLLRKIQEDEDTENEASSTTTLKFITFFHDNIRILDKESYKNQKINQINEKITRVNSLLSNESFKLMCDEIDRLEKYGNNLCPRFFTVGTKKAKKDCVELVSELKALVTSFVFEKDEVDSKSNVIRLKLEASFEKMQHRNVFSIVAKSVLYIFECMWLCFSGGYRPDFFRTERKVIGESLIAYSDGCYKQLQGITPPDVCCSAAFR